MMRRSVSLFRDEAGSSIVEMALAAPVLAMLLIGMVDLSRGYSAKLQLEQVAQRAVEIVQNTDFDPSKSDQITALKADAAGAAGVATSAVTVNTWLECNNDGTKLAYTASCTNSGDPYARYVEVQIQKKYTPMFSTRFAGAEADGNYTLIGRSGVRVQ